MTKSYTPAAILIAAAFCATSQASSATAAEPTPERVFEQCVVRITRISAACTEKNAAIVQECLPLVRRLIADGQDERAARVARRCVGAIDDNSDGCVREIQQLCRRCVNALVELESPELARQLAQGCDRVVTAIRLNQRRARNAIISAL